MNTEAGDGLLFLLRIPARANRLKLIRAAVTEAASLCGCGPECVSELVLAVDEACQNVVRHAYKNGASGDVVVELFRVGNHLEVRLTDFAPTVDPASIKPRDLKDLRPGGLGIHFIRELTEHAGFVAPPAGAGNQFLMRKRIE
ncbi:MAG: ATP-binding protein [Alphaproteobacteria bacterium]|nr:ATP-binding protein [Alphaproteobacteria bacterium]